ncbi:stage V sporulation protein AC [Brevibacillus reuszeri]|uniref:Stage V sporulation protein AC n=1 Tax=Brevibacillus reuszeri TaxID=54915 RepID=A0A0K9YVE4_9BACL|nr:stage V sporulation protein AC [Brevibacillus reuszeri]KNB72175.1 stage V sporulation protein AC [Brevibacillus reuszeri]MED1855804.1 stage V sporulation protein AC [Brevibacillus reuszeri]GED72230.1 stage V sporulation protein AC [Brevibacillus reuszeri]
MADQKKKKLTPVQQEYHQLAKRHEPQRPLLRNFIRAFLVGGVICFIGQAIQEMFIYYFDFTEKTAGNPTVAVLIIISALLTGFGLYDRIAQWAGAGTSVPVTGFANSIASAAIEHRSEGLVLGVGGNMFKLAGSVIVFGVVAAFVIGLLKSLLLMGG